MATQRDGNSEDRPVTGGSGREPPIIEAQAQDLSPPTEPAPPSDSEPATETVSPAPDPAPSNESATTAPASKSSARSSSSSSSLWGMWTFIAALILFGGFVVTYFTAPELVAIPDSVKKIPDDLKKTVVANLPVEAQKLLGLDAKSPAPGESAAPVPPKTEPSAVVPPRPSKPESVPTGRRAEAPNKETPAARTAPAPLAQAPASSASEPASPQPSPQSSSSSAPPPIAPQTPPQQRAEPAAKPSAQPSVDQSQIDALMARIDALQAKLDARAIDGAGTDPARAEALAQRLATLEALAQRMTAIESRLDQPKSQTRASESRENATHAGADSPAAARAVVAQALTQALIAGAPLADHVSALRSLGASPDSLAAFGPFLKSGAPNAKQLVAKWAALRPRIVAADTAPVGESWRDKLMAKAQNLVKIEPDGAQPGPSAAAIFSRVEAALDRGDVEGAVAESETLPPKARQDASEWRSLAAERLKADAAARTLLTESIAAIARPKS
jgi:hypothetical protein